jgi:hypothetical protein
VATDGKSENKMNIDSIKTLIKTRKGQNLSAVITKSVKTKAAHKANRVEKKTKLVIRGGIDYDNIGVVKEGRENGSLPEQNAGLPWGEWAEFPLHITHKGQDYARFYPASGINFTPKVQYFLNGVEVDKSVIEPLCLASEFTTRKFILIDLCDPNEEVKKLNVEEVKEFLKQWNSVYGTAFESPEDFNSPLYSLEEEKPTCFTIKAENVVDILI